MTTDLHTLIANNRLKYTIRTFQNIGGSHRKYTEGDTTIATVEP